MTIYSYKFTTNPSSSQTQEIELEGDVITKVRIRFPPGPQGLLRVAFFYGIKQIFPYNEGEFFYGDNEVIEWEEYFPFPETPLKLKIKLINDDDTYSHSCYIIIVTRKREDLEESRLAKRISSFFRFILGRI